jgi:FAD/FMN-containing dehydrogenase
MARPAGIAGLTPGGGHGYLMRTYGLACDQLLSVGVVTADGPLRACAPLPSLALPSITVVHSTCALPP